VLAVSCNQDATDESTLERIKRTGVVRVGFANEAPYAYVESESGDLTGEAPVVARRVFRQLGVGQLEGVLTEFGSLIPGLKANRFDIIAAGMYITPERALEILFSEPTYCISEAFIVASGNPQSLHSYEDVANHESARLGVVAGTVERGYARSVGVPDERVVVLPDAPSALEAVRTERIDAYAGTSLTVQYLLDRADDARLERAVPFSDPLIDGQTVRGCGAFGIRLEDTDLQEAVNQALAAFLGTPEHLELVKPFGFTAAELPGEVRTADLIGK
jgi:polar amino acid transport system substrate-binding protein